jgi:hypothetical protein
VLLLPASKEQRQARTKFVSEETALAVLLLTS